MKNLLLLSTLIVTNLNAQGILEFNKRFVQSEDKWVAFQMDKDSTYSFGFIYIDAQAGLTFDYKGKFKITQSGKFVAENIDSYSVKIRLEPNRVKVAFIPEYKLTELSIKPIPDWLESYKKDTGSIERLYRWGFLYNAWNESAKALTYLERAQKINPKFQGLEFELAYAYNVLEQYEKAITILKGALESEPQNCYLYKELSYAEMYLGQLEKASETCKKGIKICSEKPMKCEIAYNMAYHYYKIKDKDKFHYWYKEAKKWSKKGDQFRSNLTKMEEDINN